MNMRRSLDHVTIFSCEDVFRSRANQVPQACAADDRTQGNEQQPHHTTDDPTDSVSRAKTSDSDADNQLDDSQQREHTKQCCEWKVCAIPIRKMNDRENSKDDCQNQPSNNQRDCDRTHIAFAVNKLLPDAHVVLLKRISRFRSDQWRGVGIE